MYFSAETNLTDATGQPVTVVDAIDPNFGTIPSVSPALIDPSTGQLLPLAQPIKPGPTPIQWLTIGSIALSIFLYLRKKK